MQAAHDMVRVFYVQTWKAAAQSCHFELLQESGHAHESAEATAHSFQMSSEKKKTFFIFFLWPGQSPARADPSARGVAVVPSNVGWH